MALTAAEQRELDELELQELEAEDAGAAAAPVAPPTEPGLKEGGFSIRPMQAIAEMLGLDTNAAGRQAANTMAQGYAPQLVGGAKALAGGDYLKERDKVLKTMEADKARSPGSSMLGMGAGALASGGALSAAAPVNAASALGRVGQAGAVGAAQGAVYNPGDVGGELNPVQAGARTANAGIGALLGLGGGAVGEGIGKGAQIAEDARLMSMPGKAARWASDKMGQASDKLEEFIKGKAKVVEQGVQGRPITANLQQIKEAAPKLAQTVDDIYPRSTPIMQEVEKPGFGPVSTRVGETIKGEDALLLKRALDDENWLATKGVMTTEAKAKDRELESLANALRNQINDVSPEVAEANRIVSKESFPLRGALDRASYAPDPMGALTSKSKAASFDLIDEMTGSDLLDAQKRMQRAQWLQLDPTKLATLNVGQEVVRTGARGAAEAARLADKATPAGTKESLLQAILESKRQK